MRLLFVHSLPRLRRAAVRIVDARGRALGLVLVTLLLAGVAGGGLVIWQYDTGSAQQPGADAGAQQRQREALDDAAERRAQAAGRRDGEPGAGAPGERRGDEPPTAPGLEDGRPNILFISSDDQTDLEMRWMPKTRRLLGRHGIDFTDAINPHPLCCPARAEILTGEYAQNNGVRHNDGPFGGFSAFKRHNLDDNLGVWLQQAGYRTGFIGKPLNGYVEHRARPEGWDRWNPTLLRSYGYTDVDYELPVGDKVLPGYVTDTNTALAQRMVQRWSVKRRPFFIWISQVGPHDAYVDGRGWGPPVPADRHADLFANLKLPSRHDPGLTEDVSDKPLSVRRAPQHDLAERTEWFRQRVRSLQAIDESNARMVRALARAGVLDRTLVIYTSDNGYELGQHGLWGKNLPYAENLQIPLLMRGPGIAEGATSLLPATTVDLAPTFLDAAGALDDVRASGRTDGESLLRMLTGSAETSSTQLIQAGTADERALDAMGWAWRGVRTPRYTWLVRWTGVEELYDHRLDPHELHNLIRPDGSLRKPAYVPVRDELRARYERLAACHGVAACERQPFGPDPLPVAGRG
ncbi:sulfatase family protein [Nocardioides acrostichi]|uniref:Sulfatase n=1 Tax=Nocardioides acrostichi TaxID=2784339 RepID=A0A930V1N4_9ACTN|nr:sulfatase [Nocardioides acrostichi]MBF4161584.1 sulfatase [Nocardioides acrostichi]